MTLNILIEGFTELVHSYSIININQILALRKNYPSINLYLKEVLPQNDELVKFKYLPFITTKERKILQSIPVYNKQKIDFIYKISYPFDSKPNFLSTTLMFYTSEFGKIKNTDLIYGNIDTLLNNISKGLIIPITPSNWSANSLKIKPLVITLGTDISKFYPIHESLIQYREELGIALDGFVFLNIGRMSENKNVKLILKSFYKLSSLRNDIYLVLKGLDEYYDSCSTVEKYIDELINENIVSRKKWVKIQERVVYIPDTYDSEEMNILYNISDCYISPYLAEAFNLPVLDAIATGIPVIVSKGGPTDDFTDKTVALYPITVNATTAKGEKILLVDDFSLQEQMIKVINDSEFRSNVKKIGPEYIKSKKLTWDDVSDQLFNIFTYLLQLEKTSKEYKKVR